MKTDVLIFHKYKWKIRPNKRLEAVTHTYTLTPQSLFMNTNNQHK